jgi:branched-chain amino acid transport system substrate-binding protein
MYVIDRLLTRYVPRALAQDIKKHELWEARVNRIAYLSTTAVVALLTALSVPSSAQNTAPIKLGLSAALTGPFNEFGEGIRRATVVAIDEWNEKGGVLGRKIELAEPLDDQLVPDRAVQNVRRILDNPDIVAMLAPGASGTTMATVGMAVADGRPFCNSQAQTPAIAHPDGPDKPPYPNVFSTAMSISSEAEKIGKYAAASFNKIGIVSESTSYGKFGSDFIRKSILEVKPNASITMESYNQKTPDMTAQIVRLQREGAEVILLVGIGVDAAAFRKTMARLNVGLPLYGLSGLHTPAFLEGSGDLAAGVRATNATTFGAKPFSPRVQAFLKRYRDKFGTDRWYGPDAENPQISMGPLVAGTYDCVNVLLDGIRRAGTTEPKALVKAIEETKGLPGILIPSISFSSQNHSAFSPNDLAIYEIKKSGDKLAPEVVSR